MVNGRMSLFLDYVGEILSLFWMLLMKLRYQILRIENPSLCWFSCAHPIFFERKGKHFDLDIPSGKQGSDLARQHVGVRACNIQIDIFF